MSARVPFFIRWILVVSAPLVPESRREDWHRQWVAEIEHRCSHPGRTRGLMGFALGSLTHALYLRRREMTMRGLGADLVHSARALARRPGFSLLTVATLAIGIGAATAIFSLGETLLLRPLPLEHNDRLVAVYSSNPSQGMERFSVSYPDFQDFAGQTDIFEAASFYMLQDQDVSGEGDPERVRSAVVHEDFFQTLGTPAVLGRTFSGEDYSPASPASAILSESFWARRFGSDSTVVGRDIRLDGVPHTVVGVVRDRQGWPARTAVWRPIQWGGVVPEWAAPRSNHTWQVVARTRPGVDADMASLRVEQVARATYTAEGVHERQQGIAALAVPLHSSGGGDNAAALFALLGTAVFFVLLIACMNASGLLLTRAWGRTRELSLRSALGAGRTRLMAILLGESAVLALVGGALGIGLGTLALTRAFAMAPPGLSGGADVTLNGTVLAAGLFISAVAALLAGTVPALRASRVSVAEALKEGGGQAGHGRGSTRLRQALVVGELCLSLVLLVGAGLVMRGFQRQVATDPGFQADNLLSFTVRLPATRYGEDALVDRFYEDAVTRLERHPGILSASSTSRLPLDAGGFNLYRSFIFDGATPPPEGAEYGAAWVEADPSWFETMDVRPSEGRAFTDEDDAGAPLVIMVNQRLAHLMSPGESMVGRTIRSYWDENLPRTVVGVIPDLQLDGVSRAQRRPMVLVPRNQSVRTAMAFMVRTAGPPEVMIPVVRQAMSELDGDVALDALQSMREAHAADLAGIRFLTSIFTAFGVLALILAVSGVYGLVSYSVSQRTQEIGVRMAMGASSGAVRGAVIRESGRLAAIGVPVGLALAYAGGRILASGVDGIALLEVSTFAGVTFVLLLAVLGATWFPAVRATQVDPVEALRSE